MKEIISIEGEKIDLDEIRKYSNWMTRKDGKVALLSKDGERIIAVISMSTLINCWIEKEEEHYNSYKKR